MKIEGKNIAQKDNMLNDNVSSLNLPTDMPVEDDETNMLLPAQNLIQEFGDFSFLLQLQDPDSLKMEQVSQDLRYCRDNFLNENIRSILTFANTLNDPIDFNRLLQLVKQLLRRKFTTPQQLIVMIKFCFLMRWLIRSSHRFSQERRMLLYREILDVHQNHYSSTFSNADIINEANLVQNRLNATRGVDIEEAYPFSTQVAIHNYHNPCYQIYVGEMLQTGVLLLIKDTFPVSLDIFAGIQKFVDQEVVEAILPTKEVLERVEQYLLAVPNDNQAITKQQIEHILKYTEQLCSDSSGEKRKRITEMELHTATYFLKSPSMDKKLWALSLINDKIRLLKSGGLAGIELSTFLDWLDNSGIYESLIQQNVHPEVMARSNQLVPFLYEKQRLGISEIEDLVKFTIKSESDAISKLTHHLIAILQYRHLERIYDLVVEHTAQTKHLSASSVKILESIISSQVLNQNDKKTKKKRMHSTSKDDRKSKNDRPDEEFMVDEKTEIKPIQADFEGEPKHTPSPLIVRLFTFVIGHMEEYPLIHLIGKLISAQPLVFSMVPQQLINSIREDRPNSITFLDSIIKLPFPISREKGTWTREEFVSWLAGECIFEYLLAGIAKNRFDKSLNERLNMLVLLAKYHKPFEKNFIQFLWKILGLRAIDERQRQQFFLFVKDCLMRGSNQPLFTEEAVNYVYFGILLKLHASWFSLKIYECFEMFFLRFNQDCKLITYLNGSPTTNYQLVDPHLIGLNKFWYIYLTGEDPKVVKKCKDFLCRLVSKFDCEEKIFLLIKQQYISMILNHINSNLEALKNEQLSPQERNKQLSLLAKCLEMLIRVIEELEGKRLSGQKPAIQELTFNIDNTVLKDALPPKCFTMKADSSWTLKQLREQIGLKINPPKKSSQIRLMTQGRYLKGQNLTIKDLKFDNKQHFKVDSVEQMQSETQKLDENMLKEMKAMFPNHSEPLIRYVMFKRYGQDEQVIAQALLDDEAVAKYTEEMKELMPSSSKMISELLSSTQNIFETFFEVLNVQNQDLSLLTWKIISNIPNNPYYTNLIRETILKTNDWNEIIPINSNGNFFKTLYNLHLLKSMLSDTNADDQQLKHKFVENGGFDHLYQITKVLMQKWKGDALQAKLLTYLLQVIRIYVKPHLQSLVKKPLSYIFKEVSNYKVHLKEIAQDSINHIVDVIVTPQRTNTTSKEKSFSFKVRSNSSHQTPTNQTPNFQYLNASRSNSPHSEKPNDKEQDNLSSLSGSKSSNLNKVNHRAASKQDPFSIKMQQNLNLNLQLHHYINIPELTVLILLNIGMIVGSEDPVDNQDIANLSEELFDILFPSLLVGSAHETVYNQQDVMRTITQGVALVHNEQFRIKLVYMVFLLCVVSDILDQNKIMVEDDDELFMTSNSRSEGPKVYFIQQLLPIFQPNKNIHESYFICLTMLIKEISTSQLEQLMAPQILLKQVIEAVLARPVIEQHDRETEDYTLNGLMALIQVLFETYKPLKKQYSNLVPELFNFLFYLPQAEEGFQHIKNYPKCKRKCTRRRCLNLLLELACDHEQSRQLLIQQILKYCENLSPKEYESTVMRSDKYPGLRNLGSTCYINSLLQQIHKNTLLGPMLCNKDIIQIDRKQPLFQLAHLMSSMSHSLKNTINPIEFIKSVRFHGSEEINPLVQQDVNQFFLAFVDLLEKNNAQSLLGATLMGEICNELTGQDELRKFVKKGIEQFYTISLDIKGKKSLVEALQYYIKADVLDGDNMYHSEELNKKVRATKRSYIRKLPNTLVFTLKRFEFDYNTMLRHKLNDYLEFPMELDMLKFSEQHLSEQYENLFDEGYYKYRLAGVLVHSGTAESGHYYSYIRDTEKWYEFNDSTVSEFNIANLKSETFGGDDSPVRGVNDWDAASNKSRNAYLLFYERVQPIENPLNLLVKDHQIKGEFMDLVWRENLQFLRSRLVFDADFLKFLEDLFEMGKDKSLSDLMSRLQHDRRSQSIAKIDMEIQEMREIEPLPKPISDIPQLKYWNAEDDKEQRGLIDQLDSNSDKMDVTMS